MNLPLPRYPALARAAVLIGVLATSVFLSFLLLSRATAQETETPEVTVAPDANTVVKIQVNATVLPVPDGDQFEAEVLVENVEHLAGFDFTISYDGGKIEPVAPAGGQTPAATEAATPGFGGAGNVEVLDTAKFLKENGQRTGVICDAPKVDTDKETITVSCFTTGPPLCLDGPAGAAGSGVLGRVQLRSKGGGKTTLELSKTTLVLDDYVECLLAVTGTAELPNGCLPFLDAADPNATELSCEAEGVSGALLEGPVVVDGLPWYRVQDLGWASGEFLQADGETQAITHKREDATVDLEGGGSSGLLIGIIGAIVAVVVVGGAAGGYVWYRRRGASA